MKVCSVCGRCYEDAAQSCAEENHGKLSPGPRAGVEMVEGYRLDFLLGADRTGETYRATDVVLGEPRIVRILDAAAGGAEGEGGEGAGQRFLTEARALAAVHHPNAAHVFGAGSLETGELYVVTEAIEGQTLRRRLSDGVPVPEELAVKIARQAAEGLQAMLAAGAPHRNINPENIVLVSGAESGPLVKIQNPDFGGARRRASLSSPEHHLHELKYFPPELFEDRPADELADVYGLGVVLYEMLAGQPPFEAPGAAALIDLISTAPPRPPQIINFDIRALLTHTLTLSLQKVPERRLKSSAVFARQLRHIEQLTAHTLVRDEWNLNAAISDAAPSPLPPKPARPVSAPAPQNNIAAGRPPTRQESAREIPVIAPAPLARPETVPDAERAGTAGRGISHREPLEWEQPDDLPSEAEVLEVLKKESAGAESAAAGKFSSHEGEPFTDVDESEVLTVFARDAEEAGAGAAAASSSSAAHIFSYQEPARRSPARRRRFVGAGLLLLLVSVVTGALINRYSPPPPTVAATAPPGLEAEAPKSSAIPRDEGHPAGKVVAAGTSERTRAGDAQTPNFSPPAKDPPPVKPSKTTAALPRDAENASSKAKPGERKEAKQTPQALKTAVAKNAQTGQAPAAGKKPKSVRKLSPAQEAEILGRPRIVKNVGGKKRS